ncbi:hypothetical protein ACNFU2_09375 [Chryseobacterium sp. PTM-20240506]|uniref:hypothetical protein n=1 Tax=unclassified Chryseobacterium TaxID=2593645 RepID=UPI002359EF96|nr:MULTISPECIES: hypothetical protein [unclassified Chryseobacterium]MDC8105106.1 hypothetical protein [Chryseobacterium sp. B21-037]MDQ1805363.1 hypothetical protein [Chryseobacterium sp. CKR4-1]
MYKKINQTYILGIFCGFLISCKGSAQNFSIKNVSQNLISKYYSPNYTNEYYKNSNIFFVGVDSSFLKENDHTDIIQKAIDNNENILLPDATLFINKNGLKIGSNKRIIFQKNTKIKFLGPAHERFSDILKIYNVHNVEIINAVIVGSRNNKIEQTGQWSAGISILNSKNIKIVNPKISETYGDGIFIGSEDGGFSEEVIVSGGWVDSARRNGISITSGKNVKVQNILISNTYGHDPESGIDIEPSWYKDILENISVQNVYTFNNGSAGISVNLNALGADELKDAKITSILIEGHTDFGSRHGFLTSLNAEKNKFDTAGNIIIKNAEWISSRDIAYWKTPQEHRVNIIFSRIKINDTQKLQDFELNVRKSKNIKLTR